MSQPLKSPTDRRSPRSTHSTRAPATRAPPTRWPTGATHLSHDDLLNLATQMPQVGYAAVWDVPTRDCHLPDHPTVQRGNASEDVTQPHRHRGLKQVVGTPHRSWLLGDDRQNHSSGSRFALLGMFANPCGQKNALRIVECHFQPETDLNDAANVLKQIIRERDQNRKVEPAEDEPLTTDPGQETVSEPWITFCQNIHRSLRLEETACCVANELVSLLKLDRVSVVGQFRHRWTVQAVSGQIDCHRRSDTVRQLEVLTHIVARNGQSVHYPEDLPTVPQPVRKALEQYLEISPARSMMIRPITRSSDVEGAKNARRTDSLPESVLVLESFGDEREFGTRPHLHEALLLAGGALQRSHDHNRLFLLPVWQFLGNLHCVMTARRHSLAIGGMGCLVVLALLCFWPARFYVTCNGVMVPALRHRIYAPLDGIVEQVFVSPDQTVEQNQPLVRLRNYSLETRIQQVQRQLAVVQQQIRVRHHRIRSDKVQDRFPDRDSQTPLAVLLKEETNLVLQQQLLDQQKQQALVASPIAGTVTTWQVDQELRQRPVPMGRVMMEVADLQGDWKLELYLPDRRIGHLLQAARHGDSPLQVEFVVAAQPDQRFRGTLSRIDLTTAASHEDGRFIRLQAELEGDSLPPLRNESQVTAKIFCGQRTLGYVWFHDLTEFLQKRVFLFLW